MAKIDLNMVVRGEEYIPQVGTEYELGPGVVGTMRYPTVALQKKVQAISDSASGDDGMDLLVCKEILEGLPDDLDGDGVSMDFISVVVADFFMFALKISDGLQSRFAKYVPSAEG